MISGSSSVDVKMTNIADPKIRFFFLGNSLEPHETYLAEILKALPLCHHQLRTYFRKIIAEDSLETRLGSQMTQASRSTFEQESDQKSDDL